MMLDREQLEHKVQHVCFLKDNKNYKPLGKMNSKRQRMSEPLPLPEAEDGGSSLAGTGTVAAAATGGVAVAVGLCLASAAWGV